MSRTSNRHVPWSLCHPSPSCLLQHQHHSQHSQRQCRQLVTWLSHSLTGRMARWVRWATAVDQVQSCMASTGTCSLFCSKGMPRSRCLSQAARHLTQETLCTLPLLTNMLAHLALLVQAVAAVEAQMSTARRPATPHQPAQEVRQLRSAGSSIHSGWANTLGDGEHPLLSGA
jgi:hypothetical protein